MVTIKDIAREAGVSISTVSFAFNGTAPVAPETKARIMEVIKRLNYQPNSAARGLVTRKTNTVCLFTPHPATDFFSFSGNNNFNDLLQGIGEVLDHKDYNLLLAWDSLGHKTKTPKLVKLMRERAMDGVLICLPEHDFQTIEELTEQNFPVVIVGSNSQANRVNSVDVDNYEISYKNTRHLLGLGHRRIAFISPGPLNYLVCEDRYEGFKDAMEEAGLRLRDDYLYIGDEKEQSGYKAAERFLTLKEPPTALVAGRDAQAVGVIDYARAHGVSVPSDLAIVSFENSAAAVKYGISSATTNLYEIGKEGARLMLKLLGRKKDRAPQNVVIPSELVVRESCGGHADALKDDAAAAAD